jgi:major intrinsic protein
MNPARSFGPALVGDLWDRHWLYWLAPITAMMAAARIYDLLRAASPPGMPPLGRQESVPSIENSLRAQPSRSSRSTAPRHC